MHTAVSQNGHVQVIPRYRIWLGRNEEIWPGGKIVDGRQVDLITNAVADCVQVGAAERFHIQPLDRCAGQLMEFGQGVVDVEAVHEERDAFGHRRLSEGKKIPRPADRGGPRCYPWG